MQSQTCEEPEACVTLACTPRLSLIQRMPALRAKYLMLCPEHLLFCDPHFTSVEYCLYNTSLQ